MLVCRAIRKQVADREAPDALLMGTQPVGAAAARLAEWVDGITVHIELRSKDKLLAAFLPCALQGGLLTALLGPRQTPFPLVIDKTRGR